MFTLIFFWQYMLGKGILRLGGLVTAGRLLQIGAALILMKLLTPIEMGTVGILTAVFVSVYSLSNFGFDRYLIHSDDEDISRDVINNIWTLQIIRGLIVFSLCLMIALILPLVSDFKDDITFQLIVIGLALMIYSFANPEISLFERKKSFAQIANCQGASITSGALVTAISAFILHSPWAYVLGQLASMIVYALLTFYYSVNRPHLSYDGRVFKKIIKYCKYLLIISVVSVIAVQFENFYIAIVFGAETLGFYFTWARLVYMPREILVQISDKILFVKACSSRRDSTSLAREHLFVLSLVIMIILPFYGIVWFHGGWFISLLAGDEWVSYAWVGKFFVVISSIWLLALLFSPLVLANYPKVSSILRFSEVFLMILLMLWLGSLYDVEGVLIASLVGVTFAMIIRLFIVYRYVITESWYKHLLALVFILVLGIGGFLGGDYFLDFSAINSQPGIAFIICSLLLSFIIGCISWRLYQPNNLRIEPC